MKSCAVIPQIKGKDGNVKDSKLFNDLLSFTNNDRVQTNRLYYITKNPKFQSDYSDVLKYDDLGEVTMNSLLKLDLSSMLEESNLKRKISENYGFFEKGTPVMRPLFYDFPEDKESWNVETEYMFGPKVLVKPITDADARETDVYLPGGASWTNAWPGATFEGGQTVHVAAPIEQIPLFTRDGYKLPME